MALIYKYHSAILWFYTFFFFSFNYISLLLPFLFPKVFIFLSTGVQPSYFVISPNTPMIIVCTRCCTAKKPPINNSVNVHSNTPFPNLFSNPVTDPCPPKITITYPNPSLLPLSYANECALASCLETLVNSFLKASPTPKFFLFILFLKLCLFLKFRKCASQVISKSVRVPKLIHDEWSQGLFGSH